MRSNRKFGIDSKYRDFYVTSAFMKINKLIKNDIDKGNLDLFWLIHSSGCGSGIGNEYELNKGIFENVINNRFAKDNIGSTSFEFFDIVGEHITCEGNNW